VRFGSLLGETVVACAAIAALAVGAFALAGQAQIGVGLAAGLVLGSFNGHLVMRLVDRHTPFVAGSVVRMALISATAVLAAILLGSPAWAVLLGVGGAQLVMAGAGIRQGLRA
jgi:hypothetical protein